jgi:hypothetical protein
MISEPTIEQSIDGGVHGADHRGDHLKCPQDDAVGCRECHVNIFLCVCLPVPLTI